MLQQTSTNKTSEDKNGKEAKVEAVKAKGMSAANLEKQWQKVCD